MPIGMAGNIAAFMLSSTTSQIPIIRVSWHVETADRLNAMEGNIHRRETFFRLLLPAHRRRGVLTPLEKLNNSRCRLADHISIDSLALLPSVPEKGVRGRGSPAESSAQKSSAVMSDIEDSAGSQLPFSL